MKKILLMLLLLVPVVCHPVNSAIQQADAQEDTILALARELYIVTSNITASHHEKSIDELVLLFKTNTQVQDVILQAQKADITAHELVTKTHQLARDTEGDDALCTSVLLSIRKKDWHYWIDGIKPYVIYGTAGVATLFVVGLCARSYKGLGKSVTEALPNRTVPLHSAAQNPQLIPAAIPQTTSISQLSLPVYGAPPEYATFGDLPVQVQQAQTNSTTQPPVNRVPADPHIEAVVITLEPIELAPVYVPAKIGISINQHTKPVLPKDHGTQSVETTPQATEVITQVIQSQPIVQEVQSTHDNDGLVWHKKVTRIRKRLKNPTIPTEKQLEKARNMMEELERELAEQENQVMKEQKEKADQSVNSVHSIPQGTVDQHKPKSNKKQKFTREQQQAILKVIDMNQIEMAEKKRALEEKEAQEQAAISRVIERAIHEEQESIAQEQRQQIAASTTVSTSNVLKDSQLSASSSMSAIVDQNKAIAPDTAPRGIHYDEDLCELSYDTTIQECLDKGTPAHHLNCCSIPGTSVKFICDACFKYWEKTFQEKISVPDSKLTMEDFPCPFCRKTAFDKNVSEIKTEMVQKKQ